MRVLALDSALVRCSAAVVVDAAVAAGRHEDARHGVASRLPVMAATVLEESGISPPALDYISVVVGPGSFTGIRAGLALAHGLSLAAGIPLIGVTVGEALAEALPHLGGRRFYAAIDSRRGRVFLECEGGIGAYSLDALPEPYAPVAIAGDAAIAVAARWAAAGKNVMLTDARLPSARHVALAGHKRFLGLLPPLATQPLYIDPPEARLPPDGLRPPPLAALSA
ncbi:MAG: tRNA (adenosine(37)-N6)-threonylcarbamoyltransferase complex dimerization subunit type 1 TsaB [Acetobacteraceae bacterium]|nr:tRNA (adenosine(37)-N6)-threonylcarbamoyltransferase complex dimerization subunit type 1 TsaB [Acetobacteraceae bacterium]